VAAGFDLVRCPQPPYRPHPRPPALHPPATGALTGGLGAALVQTLRERGANLALLDLSLEAATAQARALGGETAARGWQADVRDLASLQ
jgi:hypothetical protein